MNKRDKVEANLLSIFEIETSTMHHRKLLPSGDTKRVTKRSPSEKLENKKELRRTRTTRKIAAKKYYKANKNELKRAAHKRKLREDRGDERVTRLRNKTKQELDQTSTQTKR